MAWRLHADPVMIVAAIRALLVQALEPRAMAAVDQHSNYREDPWGRLEPHGEFILDTTYGDTATAEAACATVAAIHDHVHGVDPVTGQAYSAHDPDLLLWVHAVEVPLDPHRVPAVRAPGAGRRRRPLRGRDGARARSSSACRAAPRAALARRPRATTCATSTGLRMTAAARDGHAHDPGATDAGGDATGVGAPDHRRDPRSCPGWRGGSTGSPWFAPVTPSVRMTVFGRSRVLNVLVPDHPMLREAWARPVGCLQLRRSTSSTRP